MDAAEIRSLIKSDPAYAVGALLKLYQYQTHDEQLTGSTRHINNVGFNGVDAEILSSVAGFYLRTGRLSDKQIRLIRPKLYKYSKQLSNLGGIERVAVQRKSRRTTKRRHKVVDELPDGFLKVMFRYDPDLVTMLRDIPGREFIDEDKTDKYWKIPKSVDGITKLIKAGFLVPKSLKEWLKSVKRAGDLDPDSIDLRGFKTELYPFQKQGVAFIESRKGNALIADDMGLGKTIQALAWLHRNQGLRPVLIIVPASIKLNWKKEAQRFMNRPVVTILYGQKPYPILDRNSLVIINYDILTYWTEALLKYDFSVMILDEAHRTKNAKALRTKAVLRLSRKIKHIIALTGTPILNRPIEIFNVLKMLRPDLFRSSWEFARRFCGLHHNGYAWDMSGATNKKELFKLLTSEIMLRRKKSEVLTELPDKQRIPIPVEINNFEEYQQADYDFKSYLETIDLAKAQRAERAQALAKIEYLKQLCLEGKMDICFRWIDDFLEGCDEKLVIFATHKKVIRALEGRYWGSIVKIDGSVPQDKRQGIVELFQESPKIRLFAGNIQAAGEGITLTAASNCAFLELPWTPGALEQASDRLHRIGQEADSVNIYYLVAQGTIEERILSLLDSKRKVLDEVLDGISPDQAQRSTLSELLMNYKGVNN